MTMTVRDNGTACSLGHGGIALRTAPLALLTILITASCTTVDCFRPLLPLRATSVTRKSRERAHHSRNTVGNSHLLDSHHHDPIDEESCDRDTYETRRNFCAKASAAAMAALPLRARAAIDVSGLRVEGAPDGNGVVAAQLRSLPSSDSGTAASRLREVQKSAAEQQSAAAVTPGQRPVLSPEELGSAATYARVSGSGSLQTLGVTKLNSRYRGFVEGPAPGDRPLPVSFDFPTDWLRLDKANGGLQYVDQRNGSKLYVLRAPLPPGSDLASAPRSFFDDSVFNPNGDVVRFGTEIGAHRVARSAMTQDDARAYLRRRLQLNYETVSGNGVQTIERRGLLDTYGIEGYAYIILATCNAVKFEKKDSPERATVEMIVDSFRVGE